MYGPWNLDPMRILTRRELAAVLGDAKKKAARSANAHRNLIIVRLACCYGLRVSEMAHLQIGDVFLDSERPHLRLPREATKDRRPSALTVNGQVETRGAFMVATFCKKLR